MTRLARAFFLLALLLGLALGRSGPDARTYFPHALGMRWVYTSGEVQTFVEVKALAGVEVWMLEHRYPSGAKMTEAFSFGDGVWLHALVTDGQTLLYDPPIRLYPAAPLEVGMSWENTTTLAGQRVLTQAKVVALEGVSVPLGRFNAFRIRSTVRTLNGGLSTIDYYFAPGVGVVRYATPDGGVIDLSEFSP